MAIAKIILFYAIINSSSFNKNRKIRSLNYLLQNENYMREGFCEK